MKKIFTLASAILIATSAMAYDTATEGEAYYGSSCCAYGLADGTVAITTYYLDTENPTTEITLPATIQVWNEDGTEMTAEYEVSQVGYSTWNNLWVSDGSETNVLSTMTSITFTEGIKTINTSAFGWMSNPTLTTIVLPSTMTLIKAVLSLRATISPQSPAMQPPPRRSIRRKDGTTSSRELHLGTILQTTARCMCRQKRRRQATTKKHGRIGTHSTKPAMWSWHRETASQHQPLPHLTHLPTTSPDSALPTAQRV